MPKETDTVRKSRRVADAVDPFDRRILGALVADSGTSYAALGEQVGLSAPAVHERVKRLRKTGVLKATSAQVDPRAVGKPLLAFVHVDTAGWGTTPELMTIGDLPEVEEIHTVAGDTCVMLKVRVRDTQALEALLALIYAVPNVKATRSYVVLTTYLERPIQAEVTESWPKPSAESKAVAS